MSSNKLPHQIIIALQSVNTSISAANGLITEICHAIMQGDPSTFAENLSMVGNPTGKLKEALDLMQAKSMELFDEYVSLVKANEKAKAAKTFAIYESMGKLTDKIDNSTKAILRLYEPNCKRTQQNQAALAICVLADVERKVRGFIAAAESDSAEVVTSDEA